MSCDPCPATLNVPSLNVKEFPQNISFGEYSVGFLCAEFLMLLPMSIPHCPDRQGYKRNESKCFTESGMSRPAGPNRHRNTKNRNINLNWFDLFPELMLSCDKVSRENFAELTATLAIPFIDRATLLYYTCLDVSPAN